jgi:hypothetical protein
MSTNSRYFEAESLEPIIGDLGCLGIDVEKWLKDNRAPLFPGQVNRWLLARTLRDSPSDAQVKNSLLDSFARWFPGGWVTDPWFETSEGGRQEGIDGIRVVNASKDLRSTFKNVVKSRESCTIMPTVEGKMGVLFVEVVFNYRMPATDIAWPVDVLHSLLSDPVPILSMQACPDKTDWALVAVGMPPGPAGEPKSNATVASELIFKPVGDVTETAVSSILRPALIPIWIALGIWGYSKLKEGRQR